MLRSPCFAKFQQTRSPSCATIVVLLAMAFLSSSCSSAANSDRPPQTHRTGCILASAATGAITFGAGAAGAVYATDCAPKCVEDAIRAGQPQQQAINQHINQVESTMLYAGIPAAILGAVGGGLLGAHACENARVNEYARSLNKRRNQDASATASRGGAEGGSPQAKTPGAQALNQTEPKSGEDSAIPVAAAVTNRAAIPVAAATSNPAVDPSAEQAVPAYAEDSGPR